MIPLDYEGNDHSFRNLFGGEICDRMVCTVFDEGPLELKQPDGSIVVVTDDRSTYVRCDQPREAHEHR